MLRNNPYSKEDSPLIALVTTPIGNLKDITYRAVEYLKSADIVACEDTRNTGMLLKQYDIKPKKLISLYAQTELKQAKEIVKLVKAKKLKLAYCSDAGMPGISDPGALLVQAAYDDNVPVTILPGATASLSALVISGIDSADFTFLGFLPTKPGAIKKMLEEYKDRKESLIFYESPKRASSTIALMREVFGDNREASLIRELTKIHEEVVHGTLLELNAAIKDEVKGECVIIIKGAEARQEITEEEIINLLKTGLKSGKSLSELSKEIAQNTGAKKNLVYKLGLSL
ncbi:MAG: 16S rRNA (cytidine(1402)-2'-O)-methyltransferase [Bacilli bacterium]